MPRKPRIDAPGLFYHVIARGIERREIFCDERDRQKFLERLGTLSTETETPVYAYALVPNHVHLLLRRGPGSISLFMQRLLTFYAIYFNKKYNRAGHLFQNRFKDFVCRDETYLLQLVRYINLNPLRAGRVSNMEELAGDISSAHGMFLGTREAQWFDPAPVLEFFGRGVQSARSAYLEFMAAGLSQQADASGLDDDSWGVSGDTGSNRNSLMDFPGLKKELHLQRIFHHQITDARNNQGADLENLFLLAGQRFSVTKNEIQGRSRNRNVCSARVYLAHGFQHLGMSQTEISRQLSVSLAAVSRMLNKPCDFEKVKQVKKVKERPQGKEKAPV
ncbi:MAG: transposase [Thermoleophilia bacterium]